MDAIRLHPTLRKIVEIMWLEGVQVREAVRLSLPLAETKDIYKRTEYAYEHRDKIENAVKLLQALAFSDPMSLIRLTERAAEKGLITAESIKIVLERGYEEILGEDGKVVEKDRLMTIVESN